MSRSKKENQTEEKEVVEQVENTENLESTENLEDIKAENEKLKKLLSEAGVKSSKFKSFDAAVKHYMSQGMSYPAAYAKCDKEHADLVG